MKNAQANARCGGDSGERFLRLQKSCARGKEPHFFARVAVPDHDFLHAAHAEMLAVGLVGQEGAQNALARLKRLKRLEQWRDVDPDVSLLVDNLRVPRATQRR